MTEPSSKARSTRDQDEDGGSYHFWGPALHQVHCDLISSLNDPKILRGETHHQGEQSRGRRAVNPQETLALPLVELMVTLKSTMKRVREILHGQREL